MRKKRSSIFGVKTPVIGVPIAGKTEAREEEEGRRETTGLRLERQRERVFE